MQNQRLLVILGALGLVIVLGGGYFLFLNKSSKPTSTTPAIQEEKVEVLSPDAVGLNVQVRDDGKAMKFTIEKPEGITSVDYQISYTKEINGEQVPEGLIGQVEITKGSTLGIKYREFGTCSSGKCRYDKVVSPVKLTLKVVKNGTTYSVEKTVNLP